MKRRKALQFVTAGVSAISSIAIAGFSPAFGRTPKLVPDGPFRFTRTFSRDLADGGQISIERSWMLDVLSVGSGTRISGKQISASVDAPVALGEFARIEESRVEEHLFPIMLGHDGLIANAPVEPDEQQLSEAIALARGNYQECSLSDGKSAGSALFVELLQQAATQKLTPMPRDLFFPRDSAFSSERDVTLPDGQSGRIAVSIAARESPRTGLLERTTRSFTTIVGQDRRVSTEVWTLQRI